jgi:hypothetical protein
LILLFVAHYAFLHQWEHRPHVERHA